MIIDTENLSDLDLADLKKAQVKIAKAIDEYVARKERAFAEKVAALAKEEGIQVATAIEILSKSRSASGKLSVVKYRHKTDEGKTWSGRGKRPSWLEEFGVLVDQGSNA